MPNGALNTARRRANPAREPKIAAPDTNAGSQHAVQRSQCRGEGGEVELFDALGAEQCC